MTEQMRGLTADEVSASRATHGRNEIKKAKHKGFFRRLLENLSDPIIKILLLAVLAEVILTLGRCNWYETGGILLAVLIAAGVSTVSECGSERAFAAMQREADAGRVRVFRDGVLTVIPSAELVVGDLMLLGAGERVMADAELVDGRLTVDQSALNGESRDVEKRTGKHADTWELSEPTRVFCGSLVCTGECTVRVLRVGEQTFYGTVARDVQSETRESPLKLRLSRLAKQISRIGYVMAALVALAYLFNTLVVDEGFVLSRIRERIFDLPYLLSTLIHAVTLMITVIVVAVPEGLPMMITVVLSANMKRMLRDGVLVKKAVGIETAGSLNLLFTDKTGTLTTGKMSCERIVTAEGTYRTAASLRGAGRIYHTLCLNAFYNTDTRRSSRGFVGGNSTERAIAAFFSAEPIPDAAVRERVPFSSESKQSSVTLREPSALTLIKGAPERLMGQCTAALRADGKSDSGSLFRFTEAYREATEAGERVIAVTVKEERTHVLVALIVLKDPLRRSTREAVERILGAGVQIVMMTGDGRETACAIARECGIYKPSAGHLCLDSAALGAMSDDEVKAILPRLRVLARALPSDKRRLVALAQSLELVVGMTGDGINDAPSLKLADVGFSMGSGSDIAKDASDVVLLDNSLDAIVNTILYGRTIFLSIRKFITFQLMMNLTACGVSLVGPFIGIDNPITIVQMLWVNIIMDTLGALAFAGEAPLPSYMREKPKRRDEPLLSGRMLRHILLTGGYTLLLCLAFLKLPTVEGLFRPDPDRTYFLTAFYALFIFAGLFNCLCARTERLWLLSGVGKNRPFLLILPAIALIQLGIIYYGGALFRASPLTPAELVRTVLLAFSVIPFDILCRILARLHVRKKQRDEPMVPQQVTDTACTVPPQAV